jgi:adrenodoxin-NADP+ reductase
MNYRRLLKLQIASGTQKVRKIHIAIVGTGPSGFYTAKYLLEARSDVRIDFFEKLPFPFGLVRYGVAPDHPEVKSVTSTFEEVLENNRVQLHCNVTVDDRKETPSSIRLEDVRNSYDITVLAYGASSDHNLHLPNENELQGILSARSFVNWYNGHPQYANIHQTQFSLSKVRHVVIIGQGNVALDCARILAKDHSELETTDIAKHAINQLRLHHPHIERISVIGRRGPIQAAYTIKEFRELTKLSQSKLRIFDDEWTAGMTAASLKEVETQRPKKRIVELMQSVVVSESESESIAQRSVDIRFLLTPIQLLSHEHDQQRIGAIQFERTELIGEANKQQAKRKEPPQQIRLPCDLLLKSVGYKAESISPLTVPLTTQATVQHSKGKVSQQEQLYVVGWLKRGPQGIIGTNITDAKETVASILQDPKLSAASSSSYSSDRSSTKEEPLRVLQQKYPQQFANSFRWKDVQQLLQVEEELGKQSHPPKIREKLVSDVDIQSIIQKEMNKEGR